MSDDRQTVAGAYAKIESHEDLCAERYATIHTAITDIKALLKWCAASLACASAAVIWFLLQANLQGTSQRLNDLEHRPPVTVVQSQGQR